MRLAPLVVLAFVGALAATVQPAHACSCAIVDPRSTLSEAEGAFVGTLVARRDEPSGEATLVFRLVERVKGAMGSTVEVRSAGSGAVCGVEARIGQTIGLFLDRREGRWHGSLCWQVEPDAMRDAARPLPRPTGNGPAAFVVAGTFGKGRLMALDSRLRALAYGRGRGTAVALSACPGGVPSWRPSKIHRRSRSGSRSGGCLRARPVSCSSPFAAIAELRARSSFEECTSAPPRVGRMTIGSRSSRPTPSGSTTQGFDAFGSSRAGWQAGSTACDGIRAVGVWYDGRLRELTLADGKLRFAPRLPSPAVGLVTAVG